MAIKYSNKITQFNGVENEEIWICHLQWKISSIENFWKNYKKWQIIDNENQIINFQLHNPTCPENSLCGGWRGNINIEKYFSEWENIDIILANDFLGDYVYDFRNIQKNFSNIERCQNAWFFSIENFKNSSLVFLQNHSETAKEFEDLISIIIFTAIILFICFIAILYKIFIKFFKKLQNKSPKN